MAQSYLQWGNNTPVKDPQTKSEGQNFLGIPTNFNVQLDSFSIIALAVIAFGTVAVARLS